MLAFKRSSLAASKEQDNVLSHSSRVPHPKVNRLPSPPVCFLVTSCARMHPPPLDQSAARVERSEGRAGCRRETERAGSSGCESTESLPRQTSRRTDVFLVYPELSRDLVLLRLLSFFAAPCFTRAARIHTRVIYIAPKRTVAWPAGGVLLSLLVEIHRADLGRVAAISGDTSRDYSREILS